MSNPIITVQNLGKRYRVRRPGNREGSGLRHALEAGAKHLWKGLGRLVRGQVPFEAIPPEEEFWALKDVSFEVMPGECVGIIGRNGAGKSTLLKILSRITEPSAGRAIMRGRVGSLLEVGTGFHPELTGRENIFLNGAILGMRRHEILRRMDDIVAFAEVDAFLDTPVKHYSSGMYMRLAFAVAAHLDPEILIVDEVLAVGDAQFQKKCLGKMSEVARQGRTVLFVSHNMTAVRSLCSTAILLDGGSVVGKGNPENCIRNYLRVGELSTAEKQWDDEQNAPGNGSVFFRTVRAISRRYDGQETNLFDTETPVDIEVVFEVIKSSHFHITLHFISEQGVTAFTSGCTHANGWTDQPEPGLHQVICEIPKNLLNEATYTVNVLLVEGGTRVTVMLESVISFDIKDMKSRPTGSWHGREPGVVRPVLNWKYE